MIENIVTFLRDQNIAQLGSNVYRQMIPANQSPAAGVYTGLDGIRIDHELPNYHNDDLQVIVRADTYDEAYSIAEAVSAALDISEQDVGSLHINYLRPRHLPAVYPRSEGDNYEASVNFDFNFVRS